MHACLEHAYGLCVGSEESSDLVHYMAAIQMHNTCGGGPCANVPHDCCAGSSVKPLKGKRCVLAGVGT